MISINSNTSVGAWAIGRGRQVLEFDGRGVDARAWDGRREQVLADHPTVGVDMGAALCSGISRQVAEVEARAALFSLFEDCDLPSSSMVKNCDMRGASTINHGSCAHICVWELEAGVQETLKRVPYVCESTSADDYPTAR